MVNTITRSDSGQANKESGDNIEDLGFNTMIDNIVNNPPIGENKIVNADGSDHVRVPLNIIDTDGDTTKIEIIGSACSPGDMSEIKLTTSRDTISAFTSTGGTRNLYIDYIVRDDKGNQSQPYSLDIQNLGN